MVLQDVRKGDDNESFVCTLGEDDQDVASLTFLTTPGMCSCSIGLALTKLTQLYRGIPEWTHFRLLHFGRQRLL